MGDLFLILTFLLNNAKGLEDFDTASRPFSLFILLFESQNYVM